MANIPIFGGGNPFAKFFRFGRLVDSNVKDEVEKTKNSQGFSQEQIDFGYSSFLNYGATGTDVNYGMSSISIQFEQYFRMKSQKIFKYREMSYYPDISDALDMICDEAMVEDTDGKYITLELQEEVPEHIEEQLRDYWDYLIEHVFCLGETGWELFRRWLIDGELYLELVLNADGDLVIDFKTLPPFTMTPVYDDSSEIAGYIQTPNFMVGADDGSANTSGGDSNVNSNQGYNNSSYDDNNSNGMSDNQEVRFDKDQVVYSDFGVTGRNRLDICGFLHPSTRLYNQLKYLEDAVVIYRITRAPERRVWNIGVGRMAKGKAEEYIRGLIQRYRKNVYYDPSTGAMDSSKNFQAMTEDIWFAKDENGYGTDVTTLEGGQNLGEMSDVHYFQKKLHQTLKIPKNRWGFQSDGGTDGTVYTTGKGGEITREEIQFSRFINRLQKRFGVIFLDAFITLLRLQEFDEKYIDEALYKVQFTQSNLWKQYKELEILEARFGILGAIETYIYKPGENDNAPFSMEFVLKNWFMMNDKEYEENKTLLDKEKEAARLLGIGNGFGDENQADDGFGGEAGGDFGGDMGMDMGMDMGGGDFGGEAGMGDAGGDEGFGAGADTGAEDFGTATGQTGEFDTAK